MDQGHTREKLKPIFAKAEINASNYLKCTESDMELLEKKKWIKSHKQIFFHHLQYHPEDPPSRDIQKLWTHLVANPTEKDHCMR
eukprot:scaffold15612_cov57-Cyclotella_meneghiniana.AAC.5